MYTMRKVVIFSILLAIPIALLLSFNQNPVCGKLFQLFEDTTFKAEGLKRIQEYNPDKDTLCIPPLENKGFFESIDDLSIFRRREVRKLVYIYLTSYREYVKRAIRRSFLYIDIIEEKLREYPEIPKEIALLPLLESGFNPYAVSKSRAVGLWQFISSTSKTLGLRNDRWIDERMDIEKSTKAAIYHLKNLYRIFKSWELTLAAYNGGGYHIKRAIHKTGINDFWKLQKSGVLKVETSEYVSRFAALILIFKNQKNCGIQKEIESIETVDTKSVVLKYPLNIQNISIITGIPLTTIRKFNPELKRNVIPPYYREYRFRIPAGRL